MQYDTNLAMGLGLTEETKALLHAWSPAMNATTLYHEVLESGLLSQISAYRLRNIVVRCFGNRYLVSGDEPARSLKRLASSLTSAELNQLFFIHTCRANPILRDFVTDVYWPSYEAASTAVSKVRAEDFIRRAIDDQKTPSRWADGQIERMGRYLTGCCSDFGLLSRPSKGGRPILPFRVEQKVVVYLAYELHFSGVSDNALLIHEDWQLFGLTREDVLDEIKRLSLKGLLIVQAAGDVIRISWKQPDMEALCDVLTQC
ncbi:BrxA family protein [Bordetella tumulicola]|uniref:BrxA family protein n=1 Tax=Bordetella tumulicola TaxID=1649133 RepID=UPI0039F13A59